MLYRIAFIISVMALLAGCSSDEETPLGSQYIGDTIFGSRPGKVFVDTLSISSGDSGFAVSSTLTNNTFLALGSRNGYRTSMIVRADFSNAGEDTEKTVLNAFLRLRFTDQSQTDVIMARFHEMLSPFSESDTITFLDRSSIPMPDSGLVNVEREMKLLGDYSLPRALVQSWIKGDSEHNGIAIVPADTTSDAQLTFGSLENTDPSVQPFLNVDFSDGTSTNYPMSDDGTFVESLAGTSNLIISDGYARRIYLPVDLGGIVKDATIHRADLILNMVADSEIGNEFDVYLYAPTSGIVGDPGIRSGTGITRLEADPESGVLTLTVRNILLLFLNGTIENNGFVLQFDNEGSQIRQLEFYPSSAGTDLRPSIRITYSLPPEFRSEAYK